MSVGNGYEAGLWRLWASNAAFGSCLLALRPNFSFRIGSGITSHGTEHLKERS